MLNDDVLPDTLHGEKFSIILAPDQVNFSKGTSPNHMQQVEVFKVCRNERWASEYFV